MLKFIQSLVDDRAGATAMEYAIVAALIAAIIVTAVAMVGRTSTEMFDSANAALSGPTT